MANEQLFCGSDASCFRMVLGALGTSTGNATDAPYCNTSMSVPSSAAGFADLTNAAAAPTTVIAGETLWYHFIFDRSNGATPGNHLEFTDNSGFPWFAMRCISGGTTGLFYNSGTGAAPIWTQVGGNIALGTVQTIDIAITPGTPHTASMYVDSGGGSILVANVNFNQPSFTNIASVKHLCPSNTCYYGSVIGNRGIPTIAARVCNRYPTGAGATNTFSSGTFADIDETGINDADLMASNASGQKATFVYSDIPALPNGYVLGDTFVFTRIKNDGTAPQNCAPVRRDSGGVDNLGANFVGVNLAYAPYLSRYAISFAEFNASQFGFQSAP